MTETQMNINLTNYNTNNSYKPKRQSFGSAADVVTQGLRYLNVNEAVGATLVDFGFMAMPRTIVDSKRGFDAGVETGIRENSGTLNHVLIGTVGGAAAYALSQKFNKDYNILSHTIFANNETIDILGKIWHENYSSLKNNPDNLLNVYYEKAFSGMRGLNSSDSKTAKWVELKPETISKLTETMVGLSKNKALEGKRIPKDKFNYLKNLIISDTGAEKVFRLSSKDGKQTVDFAINSFLDDLHALGRAFSNEKVSAAFELAKNNFADNKFISNLKNLKVRSALLALGISSSIGASVQPFNRWLTKKRTGESGFVGVSNNPDAQHNKSNNSTAFIAAKIVSAAAMIGICLSSITTKFKEIPNKIQFKGKIPTLNHFKFVYGFTIASRFLAARSSDELRESAFKDILGFVNWLILGGFVSKALVTALDKNKQLLNSMGTGSEKGIVNWFKNKSVKTVDEVLLGDLKQKNVSVVTAEGNAIGFKQLLAKARNLGMTDTLKKVKILSFAQIAGYVYSGLVLGILIPKLNIAMTNWNNRKHEAEYKTDVKNTVNSTISLRGTSQTAEKLFENFIK